MVSCTCVCLSVRPNTAASRISQKAASLSLIYIIFIFIYIIFILYTVLFKTVYKHTQANALPHKPVSRPGNQHIPWRLFR